MRIGLSGAAAAAVMLLCAVAAQAATVTVRVEGPGGTLVPQTAVTTSATPMVKDGHSCSGTSAAGALDQATAGNWTGTYDPTLGFFVNSIEGVSPPDANHYWTFWLDDRSAITGICSAELQQGDSVLFFICDPDPSFACQNHPLRLTAPAQATVGQPVTAHVDQLADDGTASAASGVTISGGGSGVTDAQGNATITFSQAGSVMLVAKKTGLTTSAPVPVTVVAAGGSSAPPPTVDRTPPVAAIAGIARHQRFARGRGPRVLKGTAIDAGGLRDVQLRLAHRRGGRCEAWSDRSARFVHAKCGVANAKPFSVGAKASWSYLLPSRLGPGNYVLEVTATDAAGNTTSRHVLFAVRSRR